MLSKSQSVGWLHTGSVSSAIYSRATGSATCGHWLLRWRGNPIQPGPERGVRSAPYPTPGSWCVTTCQPHPLQPPSHPLELWDPGRVSRKMGRSGWHVLGFGWMSVPFPFFLPFAFLNLIPLPDIVTKVSGQERAFWKSQKSGWWWEEMRDEETLFSTESPSSHTDSEQWEEWQLPFLCFCTCLSWFLRYLYTSHLNKQRPREFERFAQGHTANSWGKSSNSGVSEFPRTLPSFCYTKVLSQRLKNY